MPKFEKGRSGNPGGRPKAADGLRQTLESKYGENVQQLVDKLDEFFKAKNERVRLEAWKVAMGYYYGQPTQRHEHGGADGKPIPAALQIVFSQQPNSENKT